MNAELFWRVFLETGAPEVYLLYRIALRESMPISA